MRIPPTLICGWGSRCEKLNRNADAHKEFELAVKLNPARLWAKQQLEKTPAR